jgi:MerR family transcriptional regulator, light-induced transcriptional regulator
MYAIKAVALKTGLTTHTIRVWERRYSVIEPERTETNRRLYSDEEVRTLTLLKKAIDVGHSIGQLSKIPIEEVERLVQEGNFAPPAINLKEIESEENTAEHYVASAINAAEQFDNDSLEKILAQANINFSQPVLVELVIVPFLQKLGHMWQEGNMRIAQEHVASSVVRTFLGRLISSVRFHDQGPSLISATLSGVHHEFGAMIVALTAAAQGWHSYYLGANLPVEEIAFSAQKLKAKVIVLSIVYPPGDPGMEEQLLNLRSVVPDEATLIVGGSSVESYRKVLESIGAIISTDMKSLREHLGSLR